MSPQPVGRSRWQLPDVREVPAGEDFVGIGGDLEPATLVDAYTRGLFPMPTEPGGPIGWWSPDPRCIFPLDAVRVTRSLAKSARRFTTTMDQDFHGVITRCGDPRRPQGWIDPQIVEAYTRMHQMGWVHLIEVWNGDGDLVGGLYGIEVGGLFAGESMFHLVADASKVALLGLVERLSADSLTDQRLLDSQWNSNHLTSLGAIDIDRLDYLERVAAAVELSPILST